MLAAKALRDCAREYNALMIKGGYLDGRPLTVAEVTQMAGLESRDVLLAKAGRRDEGQPLQGRQAVCEPASQVARLAAALRDKRQDQQPSGEHAED